MPTHNNLMQNHGRLMIARLMIVRLMVVSLCVYLNSIATFARAQDADTATLIETILSEAATDNSAKVDPLIQALSVNAGNGDSLAQYALGIFHHKDGILTEYPARSTYWFFEAAQLGHAKAIHNLGLAYWQGYGVNQSANKAITTWKKASEQPETAYKLALAYFINTIDKPANPIAGFYWLLKAQHLKQPMAEKELYRLRLEQNQLFRPINTFDQAVALTTSHETTIYAAPNTRSIIGQLDSGAPLSITEQRDGWAYCHIPGGLQLWIKARDAKVIAQNALIRRQNTKSYWLPQETTALKTNQILPANSQYRVLAQYGDWLRLEPKAPTLGWIRADDLELLPAKPKFWPILWNIAGTIRQVEGGGLLQPPKYPTTMPTYIVESLK